jgi:hypothetical protein
MGPGSLIFSDFIDSSETLPTFYLRLYLTGQVLFFSTRPKSQKTRPDPEVANNPWAAQMVCLNIVTLADLVKATLTLESHVSTSKSPRIKSQQNTHFAAAAILQMFSEMPAFLYSEKKIKLLTK